MYSKYLRIYVKYIENIFQIYPYIFGICFEYIRIMFHISFQYPNEIALCSWDFPYVIKYIENIP